MTADEMLAKRASDAIERLGAVGGLGGWGKTGGTKGPRADLGWRKTFFLECGDRGP